MYCVCVCVFGERNRTKSMKRRTELRLGRASQGDERVPRHCIALLHPRRFYIASSVGRYHECRFACASESLWLLRGRR